jgi:hypothetical protein
MDYFTGKQKTLRGKTGMNGHCRGHLCVYKVMMHFSGHVTMMLSKRNGHLSLRQLRAACGITDLFMEGNCIPPCSPTDERPL